MESALAWIGQIAAWLGRFIPRREILDTTEGAIKYSGFVLPLWLRSRCRGFDGTFRVTFHSAGIHWWWPWTSSWVVYPMARQTDRLETQTMESKDGRTFLASGTLTYEVVDLMKLVPRTHSPATTTIDIAMTAVHDVCCELDWVTLQEKQRKGTLKTALRNEAQKQLAEYGISVIKLQLNTLAKCRVLKISQSTAAEEN
jgi:regulator of protease activity HflC (stomatin/prohibitin superfamily)